MARSSSSAAQIEPVAENAIWTVAVAERRFDSTEPLLRHKTTRREIYETELARSNADEVLFLNEREEVCEGARANVFLAREGVLLTPPLSSGLLPGTLRAHLLREGRAREAVLRLADFEGAEFYMGNSVRGLVRGRCAGARCERRTALTERESSERLLYFCEVKRSSLFSSALCNFASPSHSFGSPLFSLRQIW